jgi:N-acetylmuramoyl-L-alanine amidase
VRALAVLLALVLTAGCSSAPEPAAPASRSARPSTSPTVAPTRSPAPTPPLAGRVVVLDPGHQLGNGRYPAETNRLVPAGGFRKPCNTTGASTDAGYPEATFTWAVSRRVARGLEALGARVVLTRDRNSARAWGPCVDKRGRAGNSGADLKLSIHADGSYSADAHGFHVITPPARAPWTDDIAAPSRRLALVVRRELQGAGFAYATYIGDDGLDVRSDLGTLNLSDVPTVMVELGNMRSPLDARVMTAASGRTRYADALVAAVRAYLR